MEQGIDKEAFDALMTSSSFPEKLIGNEVLGIQMEFETKLGYDIISKEQKYFVRTTRLFCQANQGILVSQQMIYWADKKISLPQQNYFVGQAKPFYECSICSLKILNIEPSLILKIFVQIFGHLGLKTTSILDRYRDENIS